MHLTCHANVFHLLTVLLYSYINYYVCSNCSYRCNNFNFGLILSEPCPQRQVYVLICYNLILIFVLEFNLGCSCGNQVCGACEVELAKTEEPCPICRADLNAGAVEDVARLRKLLDGDNRPPGRHTCRAMYILGDYYFHGTGWAHMHMHVISACPTLSGYVLKIIEDPSPTELPLYPQTRTENLCYNN